MQDYKDHIEIRDLEHLEDLIKNEELLRRKEIDSLIKWVEKAPAPFVIAVDAPWGTGKTVTMDMLRVQLEDKGYKCVRFNAWECDYATDPLVPMVAEIEELFSNYKKGSPAKKLMEKATESAIKSAKNLSVSIPLGIATIGFNPATDDFTQKHRVLKALHKELEDAIAELLKENEEDGNNKPPTKLVFFIDELDRCRPTFAIELLERVKHIFDIPNVVFVLSLAKKQLEASLKSVHRTEFDANAYLHRFINLEYRLPDLPSSSFIDMLMRRLGLSHLQSDNFSLHFSSLADSFNLSLRVQERCITRLYFSMPAMNIFNAVFIAFLLCLRSNADGNELLNSFANEEITVNDMIKRIENFSDMPRENFSNTDTRHELYGHLLIADPNQERAKQEAKEMEKKLEKLHEEIKSPQTPPLSQEDYEKKWRMCGAYQKITRIYRNRNGWLPHNLREPGDYLAYMIRKIDLTEGIK